MGVDWGFAGQIGGMGFGMVFFLLVILGLVIWLTGIVVGRLTAAKNKNDDKKEGA